MIGEILRNVAFRSDVHPEESRRGGRFMLSMLEELRTDLIAGALTDWGICSNPRGCSDSSEGYLLADKDEISLRAILKKWSPYVIFDFKPVMTVDQTINGIKKAAATIKK